MSWSKNEISWQHFTGAGREHNLVPLRNLSFPNNFRGQGLGAVARDPGMLHRLVSDDTVDKVLVLKEGRRHAFAHLFSSSWSCSLKPLIPDRQRTHSYTWDWVTPSDKQTDKRYLSGAAPASVIQMHEHTYQIYQIRPAMQSSPWSRCSSCDQCLHFVLAFKH